MPVNRNALIRYRTIDNCLRNRFRQWTLDDLMEACANALYEYEGIDKGVSRRTVQMDIQMMRSDKLGYNAPIIVLEKKYYTYEDPDYAITNIPLTEQDLGKLTEVVEILRQFKGFNHFQELSGMVQRLENKIYSARTNQEPVIDFEKNEDLQGLEYIDTLYQAIVNKCAVTLGYQSFKARNASTFTFHPYYLKEYRNRWFVLGIRKKKGPILTLALDRIQSIDPCEDAYVPREDFTLPQYLNDVIGVTVNANTEPEKVLLLADAMTAPYILTKPLHHSQRVEEQRHDGVVISLRVQLNFELEREILGFGDRMKVLGPEKLKRRIRQVFEHALDLYHYDFTNASLRNNLQKLVYKGYATFNHVFGKRDINRIRHVIGDYLRTTGQSENTHAIRNLLTSIPDLVPLVFTTNLLHILRKAEPALFLTKAIYFDKTADQDWYVTWHQDTTITVKEKIDTPGFTGWTKKSDGYGVCPPEEILQDTFTVRIHLDDTDHTNGALQVLPGSHKKKFTDEEVTLITANSLPQLCEVQAGGVQLMKPLILNASSKATSQKHRRVVHLEFNKHPLPNGLTWAEYLPIPNLS